MLFSAFGKHGAIKRAKVFSLKELKKRGTAVGGTPNSRVRKEKLSFEKAVAFQIGK